MQYEFGGQLGHFTKYLTNLGIVHRITCPQTFHLNGIIEQKHKQIVEMGITLLAHALIPRTY